MPVIKNNTRRNLFLSDFNGKAVKVSPNYTIESPYFYTTISGADVISEEPYYEEIVDYALASGTADTDYKKSISSETDYINLYNLSDENITVYLNSKETKGYIVPADSTNSFENIKDRVIRVYVDFPDTVDSGVYIYEFRNAL